MGCYRTRQWCRHAGVSGGRLLRTGAQRRDLTGDHRRLARLDEAPPQAPGVSHQLFTSFPRNGRLAIRLEPVVFCGDLSSACDPAPYAFRPARVGRSLLWLGLVYLAAGSLQPGANALRKATELDPKHRSAERRVSRE